MSTSDSQRTPWWFFLAGSLLALIICAVGAGSVWFYTRQAPQALQRDRTVALDLYQEAWALVQKEFDGELPPETVRTYGAIRGSLETLHDPYTYFVEPEPAVREQEQLQGHFGGIGAYLSLREDGYIALDPTTERPAAKAGVLSGDLLLTIEGEELPRPGDVDAAADRLRGPVGSEVHITVLRGPDRLPFTIERAQIELPTVTWQVLEQAPAAGYIRIERFSGLTDKELTEALRKLNQAGADDHLILDLRGNPGGLFDAAIAVSSHFLEGGAVVIERRSDHSEHTYGTSAGPDAPHADLLVLVDEGSASAAEIVAGALRDRGRARLIGQTTYGKGSIQRIYRLSDNSAVHITFGRWFTPNGSAIDGQGLQPDVLVEVGAEADADAILEAAIQLLPGSP